MHHKAFGMRWHWPPKQPARLQSLPAGQSVTLAHSTQVPLLQTLPPFWLHATPVKGVSFGAPPTQEPTTHELPEAGMSVESAVKTTLPCPSHFSF